MSLNAFKKDFEILRQDVIRLHYRWAMFSTLFSGPAERGKLLQRRAPVFFQRIHEMLVDNIVLGIARLTDPPQTMGSDNLVLARLLQDLEALGDAPELADLTSRHQEIVQLAEPFRKLRHKLIAHRDLNAARAPDEFLPGISKDGTTAILRKVAEFMNVIETKRFGPVTGYESGVEIGGTDELVSCLKKAEEYDLAVDEEVIPRDRVARGRFRDA